VLISTVALKVIALIICYRARMAGPAVRALVQDHRNDIITNSISLTATYIAAEIDGAWWVDPVAALLFSLYLLVGWVITGQEQVRNLSGKAASKDVVAALTWVAMTAHPAIHAVDTVRAYHIGTGIQAEIDIVLSPDMPLREAHDIAEALTLELEAVPQVERAFVHLDFETEHSALDEHRYTSTYRAALQSQGSSERDSKAGEDGDEGREEAEGSSRTADVFLDLDGASSVTTAALTISDV
jgi:divalent metal cation (Fe/Co/Zn/Cd) transporter